MHLYTDDGQLLPFPVVVFIFSIIAMVIRITLLPSVHAAGKNFDKGLSQKGNVPDEVQYSTFYFAKYFFLIFIK